MMAPVMVQQPAKRRGCFSCSCTSCLLLLVVLVILPVLACGVLSYTAGSLGPGDLIAVYFPGDFGRKTVEFEADNHTISIEVPRSWYPAIKGDVWWDAWRPALDSNMPLVSETDGWKTYEVTQADLDSGREGLTILEISPVTLGLGGGISGISFVRVVVPGDSGEVDFVSFRCDAMRDSVDEGMELLELDNGLCGIRADSMIDVTESFFESYDPPDQMQVVHLFIPESETLGSEWVVIVPDNQYDSFKGDIDKMIESVSVK
jgi:hypothetical protein